MLDLEDIFGAEGPLKRALADFTLRRPQLAMARRLGAALERRESLVVEAGTGTGKTFAYLVPALLSGARVLISTGTRTLQDQLFAKDLPLVAAALGRPARVALLKGRSNYLCQYRLDRAGLQMALEGIAHPDASLARIERWSRITRTGDLAEVPGLKDSHPLWPQITSTRENCLGARCSEIARCHVAAARRAALEADVVIVNHHLLLADLALKEDGFGDILGSADAVILDEAHQLADLAAQFFGANVGSRRIETLLLAIKSELAAPGEPESDPGTRSLAAASAAVSATESALRELAQRLPKREGRASWEECSAALKAATTELADCVEVLAVELEHVQHLSALGPLSARTSELAAALARITAVDELEGARTLEISARGFVLHLLPFDVSARFRALIEARPCAWIFTSATLSIGEDFSAFTHRLGLDSVATLKIESPFDYERQCLLYLPVGLPEPSDRAHVAAVLSTAIPLIEATRGGAFILFTSHRALAEAAGRLRELWADTMPYRLYVQGEGPRERLLHDFRADGDGVLLGTASFWEGVDVKGSALRLVVIDKLPFASPDDPVVKARIDHIQSTGGNPFRDYQLPEAALALKQGVGRLIRSEEDYGAVVICDRRLTERSYGRVFRAALPAMSVTRDEDEALRFLRRHAPRSGRAAVPASQKSA
jgi:ATP-dependent DNA helicase DinG